MDEPISYPPKEVASNLLHIFYRLKYQKTPSWYNGLSESEVNKWKLENTKEVQEKTTAALEWVLRNPESLLTNIVKNMNRTNEEIHIFCKNFVDSIERTTNKKGKEELFI